MRNQVTQIPSGETYQKARPSGLRVYSAIFAFLPVLLYFFPEIATYLDQLSVVGLYVCWFVCAGVGLALLAVWVKFVPTVLSFVIAAFTWIALVVLVAEKLF